MPAGISVGDACPDLATPAGTRPARRILVICEAGDFYPSGFIRAGIYRDHFLRAGYEARYVSRLPQWFLRMSASPPPMLRRLLRLPYAAKLFQRTGEWATQASERAIARAARDADAIYMSKVTSLPFVKELRASARGRIVLDFGDAVWLPRWRNEGLNDLLGMVDAVTTDNELTGAYIRRFNPNCTVIPDCPQVEWFDRRRSDVAKQQGPVTLGWIGTPGTAYNLYVVWEALERLFDKHHNIHLRILGATPEFLPPFEKVRYSFVGRYTQDQMIDEALKMDIGLFPLQDVEACRVRGVLKATVYMSAGVVPVCSPVGQCVDFIRDGENGMLADTAKDWEQKLALLILDPGRRKRLGDQGLSEVRARFTVDKSFALLKKVLEDQ